MESNVQNIFNSQVDGLYKIYTYEKIGVSVYFEFESAEKVRAAVKGVIEELKYTEVVSKDNPNGLTQKNKYQYLEAITSELIPSGAKHVCGYSPLQFGTLLPPVRTAKDFIPIIARAMANHSPSKEIREVPVIKIDLKKLKPWESLIK